MQNSEEREDSLWNTLAHPPTTADYDPSRSVVIKGLPNGMPENVLQIILEQRSGPIDRLECSTEYGQAVVQFCKREDANKFVSTLQVIGKNELQICWYHRPEAGSRIVELSGLEEFHTEDVLRDYFTSQEVETEKIVVAFSRKTAVITFKLIADAEKVVKRGAIDFGTMLQVKRLPGRGCHLQLTGENDYEKLSEKADVHTYDQPNQPHARNVCSHDDMSLASDEEMDTTVNYTRSMQPEQESSDRSSNSVAENQCIVEVTGIDEKNKTIASLFFENKGKSGGGDIDQFIYNGPGSNKAIIIFENVEDASEVCKRKQFTYRESHWVAQRPLPSTRPKERRTTTPRPAWDEKTVLVEVLGEVDQDFLRLILTNKRRHGGGPLESLEQHEAPNYYRATFENPEDAASVMGCRQMKCDDVELNFSTFHGSRRNHRSTPQACQQQLKPLSSTRPMSGRLHTVLVRGIPEESSEDHVRLYFQDHRQTGVRGLIKSYRIVKEGVLLTYVDPADAETVAGGRIDFYGTPLSISLVDTPSVEISRYAVKITGINESINRTTLLLFLESERMSGGGKTDELFYQPKEKYAVATFCDSNVVRKLLARKSLTYEDCTMYVRPLDPPPLAEVVVGAADKERLIVRGISNYCADGDLKVFVTNHASCPVQSVIYTPEPGTALLRFAGIPDFEYLRDTLAQRPLKDSLLSIQKVKIPGSIQATDTSGISQSILVMYFENNGLSGGGPVRNITMELNGKCAVVEFEDPKVVRNVLRHTHQLEGRKLEISYYYEDVGLISPEHNTSVLSTNIPRGMVINTVKRRIICFWKQSGVQRERIQRHLTKYHASVDWDTTNGTTINLQCTLSPTSPGVQTLAAKWEADVTKAMTSIHNAYACERLTALQDAWDIFLKAAKDHTSTNNDELTVEVCTGTASINIIGDREQVKRLANKLNQILKDIMDQLEREQRSIIERMTLEAFQIDLLKQLTFSSSLESEFNVDCSYAEQLIVLKGLPEAIKMAKIKVFECIHNIVKEYISFPRSVVKLLLSNGGQVYVKSEMKKQNVCVGFEEEDCGLIVYALQRDVFKAKEVFANMFKHSALKITREEGQTLRDQKWIDIYNELQEAHKGLLTIETVESDGGWTVDVVSTPDAMENIQDKLRDYWLQNVLQKTFVQIELGIVKYMEKNMQRELTNILQQIEAADSKITPDLSSDHAGYEVVATGAVLNRLTTRLKSLRSQVFEKRHTINAPSVVETLQTPKGRLLLDGLEGNHTVVIQTCPLENKPQGQNKARSIENPVVKCQAEIARRTTVSIIQGNIITFDVDVIVNAANKKLNHAGGLAKAVVEAGGSIIQNECNSHVKQDGEIRDGRVYMSGPGKLKCKHIAHAVGPNWEDGKKGEDRYLASAIDEAMKETGQRGYKSIAIPGVSLGVYGYPCQKGTKVIVEAVLTFIEANPHTSITDVYIVDQSIETVTAFQDAIIAKLGKKKVNMMLPDIGRKPDLPQQHGKGSKYSPTGGYVLKDPETVVNAQGVEIHVRKGLIQKSKVDVIVNTTSKDLKLRHGAISQALLNAGGPVLQQDCDKAAPNGVEYGDIVKSGPGILKCKAVYHGALKNWQDKQGDAKQVMKKFIHACLATDRDKVRSIAFPPLGTGALNTPVDEAAQIMLEEINKFSKANPKAALKTVTLVIYEKDLDKFETFKSVFRKAAQPGAPKPEYHVDGDDEEDEEDEEDYNIAEETASSSNDPIVTKSGDELRVQFPDAVLVVKKGDITQENTGAILNITDTQFQLKYGAVEKEILKAGGDSILKELQVLKVGNASTSYLVTNAGQLPCKKIVHFGRDRDISTDWADVVKQCLTKAEELKLASMALPAIGTGAIDNKKDEMAQCMIKGIQSFFMSRTSTHLSRIHITVIQNDVHKIFTKTIENGVTSGGKKGFWSSFVQWLHSFRGEKGKSHNVKIPPASRPRDSVPEARIAKAIVLRLFAANEGAIDNAIMAIDVISKSEVQEHVFESKDDERSISNLTDKQVDRIESFASATVTVEVMRTQYLKYIRVRGSATEVIMVIDKIREVLRKADALAKTKEDAQQMSQVIQWEVRDKSQASGYKPYPPERNLMIERAYHNKNKIFEWKAGGTKFRIDFHSNLQETPDMAASPIDVRRKVVARFPRNWEPMQEDDSPKLVQLQTTSSEYRKVATEFNKSMKGTGVKKIERVQNPSLWSRYSEHKHFMANGKRKNTDVEKFLWHGTNADALENIYIKGLDRGYHGSHGTAYGKGAYFARDASYSQSYCPANAAGKRHMFQCRVLTGDYTLGNQFMKDVPIKDPNAKPATRYDSVVNNPANPSIYVVFSDTQAYPAYLVTF